VRRFLWVFLGIAPAAAVDDLEGLEDVGWVAKGEDEAGAVAVVMLVVTVLVLPVVEAEPEGLLEVEMVEGLDLMVQVEAEE